MQTGLPALYQEVGKGNQENKRANGAKDLNVSCRGQQRLMWI